MWKTRIFLTATTTFSPQDTVEKKSLFNIACGRKTNRLFSTVFFSTFHSFCGKLQAGVDICRYVTDIVLHGCIITL